MITPFVRLSDVTTKIGSGITPRGGTAVYKKIGRPFVRSQNVGWGTLRLDDITYIDEITHLTFPGTEIRTGDVLLNITGASIGRSAVATAQLDGGNVNQHVCEIRLKQGRMDSRFVSSFLLSRPGQDQIDTFQAGGNRQGLNFQQVGSIEVPDLDIGQQCAIGVVIDDLDSLIASLERLIAKKRAVKQGMMQQLLTGRTRLPGFTAEWQSVALGELGVFLKGRGVKRDDVRSSGVSCIRYGELYTGFINYTYSAKSFVTDEVAATALPIFKGDLLFAGSGETRDEIGLCVAYVGENAAVAGGDIIVLRGAGFNPIFLATLTNLPTVADQKARAGQGDAVVHISSRALSEMMVSIPEKPEQDAIAKVLVDADQELVRLHARLTKARAMKTGMMQQLLTGRVRLPMEASA